MNTPPTTMENPVSFRDFQSNAPARERILLLGLIYLQAGLPPDAAYRSALADYACGFDEAELCAS